MSKMKHIYFLIIAIFHLVYCQETTEDDGSPITPEPTVETTTIVPILQLSDDNPVIIWSPRSTQSVIIEALEGYKISINVTECIIDGTSGDYATITTDENTNGLLFTYGVERQPSYLYNNNRLLGEFVATSTSNFTAIFTRIGEPLTTTTTELPTSVIVLPSPEYNDSSTHLVFIGGRPLSDYSNRNDTQLLDALRDSIAAMAAKYCQNENFPLNGSITSNNVIINHLLPCQLGWPNSETCIRLNFSVPVNLIEDSQSMWTGYQMTTNHLRLMWSRHAHAYLPDSITEYSPPGEGSFKWGVALLLGGTLLFALLLLAIRHCSIKVSKMMRNKRRYSDTSSIIPASERNSQISLPPHYLQDTPALFENAYPMYNPDKTPEYSEPSFAKSFEYPNYKNLEQRADEEDEVEESGA